MTKKYLLKLRICKQTKSRYQLGKVSAKYYPFKQQQKVGWELSLNGQ